ncbi:hypothetical protein [Streptomyces guryensis]|uniref:XRE family transcriptional regulator n=1 Tax=Streptomyces guryensis TaxID=2886947 RepID=A0A9Q3VNP5_9ACTN|nr:hypothetical protein [Streptomyces guryensis]MCD9875656.1 hypothetical protein [Streptomyces guryensis]
MTAAGTLVPFALKEAPVSEPYPPLAETVARIADLCRASGKSLDKELGVARLSRAAGVIESDVETLLAGGTPPEPDTDVMVRDRVRFLYRTHTNADGKPRDIHDIAAAIRQTTTWTRKLVSGEAKPNLVVGHALCKYYGVALGFLTDPPADALKRELQISRFNLEVEVDPEQALRELGVMHMTSRNPNGFERSQLAAIAKMVTSITSDLDMVKLQLNRLGTPEDGR